jgi:hypothetical protein
LGSGANGGSAVGGGSGSVSAGGSAGDSNSYGAEFGAGVGGGVGGTGQNRPDSGCIINEGRPCDGGAGTGSGGSGGVCGPGMICKPGAIRYCDVAGIEWTKSVCDATGNWGPCLATTAPAGAGCDQNSFAPEVCCPPLFLCCQDNPGGPFVDFGSGACAAITCP